MFVGVLTTPLVTVAHLYQLPTLEGNNSSNFPEYNQPLFYSILIGKLTPTPSVDRFACRCNFMNKSFKIFRLYLSLLVCYTKKKIKDAFQVNSFSQNNIKIERLLHFVRDKTYSYQIN